ncbi:MAG: excinuclease ABC subunit UvrA, partial [Bacteroidota bacterium]
MIVPDRSLSIAEGGLAPLGKPRDVWVFSQLQAVAKAFDFSFETPLERLNDEQWDVLLDGAGDRQFDIVYQYKKRQVRYQHRFGGLRQHVWHTYENTGSAQQRQWAESFMRVKDCSSCGGGRLKPESLSYKIGAYNIADFVEMDLRALREAFE